MRRVAPPRARAASAGRPRLARAGAFGRLIAALLAAAAGPVAGASAQDAGDVDAIVVVGQPGPPIWHVISDDADVVILGTVAPLPVGLRWSRARLEAGIMGARRVLISPEPSSGMVWNQAMTPSRLATLRLGHRRTVRSLLPPDLLARYQAAATMDGGSADWLDPFNPAIVGVIVLDHARRARHLTTAEPDATIEALARHHHVRVRQQSPRAGMPTLDALPLLSQADQVRCLAEYLDDVDREQAEAADLATAWARGDLPLLRQRYRQPRACEDLIAGDAAIRADAVRDALAEIRRDLAVPGRTVVAIDLSILLDPAFQEQLRATGATVRPPRE